MPVPPANMTTGSLPSAGSAKRGGRTTVNATGVPISLIQESGSPR